MEIPATDIVAKQATHPLIKEVHLWERVRALEAWRGFNSAHSNHARVVHIASIFAVIAIVASASLGVYLFKTSGVQAIILGTSVFALISIGIIVMVFVGQFSRETLRIFAQFKLAYPDHAKHIDPLKE